MLTNVRTAVTADERPHQASHVVPLHSVCVCTVAVWYSKRLVWSYDSWATV